jgi:hypothetical protein
MQHALAWLQSGCQSRIAPPTSSWCCWYCAKLWLHHLTALARVPAASYSCIFTGVKRLTLQAPTPYQYMGWLTWRLPLLPSVYRESLAAAHDATRPSAEGSSHHHDDANCSTAAAAVRGSHLPSFHGPGRPGMLPPPGPSRLAALAAPWHARLCTQPAAQCRVSGLGQQLAANTVE